MLAWQKLLHFCLSTAYLKKVLNSLDDGYISEYVIFLFNLQNLLKMIKG